MEGGKMKYISAVTWILIVALNFVILPHSAATDEREHKTERDGIILHKKDDGKKWDWSWLSGCVEYRAGS